MQNQPESQYSYDDEIDLRDLIETMLRYKWLILAATLLAAAAAYLTSAYVFPKQYRGVAEVTIKRPGLVRAAVTTKRPELVRIEALVSRARSMNVLAGRPDPGVDFVMNASADGEDRIRLEITASDAQRAAALADDWAGAFVAQIEDEYGFESTIGELKAQLEAAQILLDQAQGKLLGARFATAQILEALLAAENQDAPVPAYYAFTLLALYSELPGEELPSGTSMLFADGYTAAQARNDLDILLESLQQDQRLIAAQAVDRVDETAAGEMTLEKASDYLQLCALERDWAIDFYHQAQVQVMFVTAKNLQSPTGQFEPVAEISAAAETPASLISPKPLTNAALAAASGLMLAVGAVFFYVWWCDEPSGSNN